MGDSLGDSIQGYILTRDILWEAVMFSHFLGCIYVIAANWPEQNEEVRRNLHSQF